MSNIFPRGLAIDEGFYDRTVERSKLLSNIEHSIHSVLIAPRRFGKTSLINQVLRENNIQHVWLDFMTITTRDIAQTKLVEKAEKLISKLATTEEKLKQFAKKALISLNPKITIGKTPFLIELTPHKIPQEGITEVLLSLDKLAQINNQRLAIVCDEFQEVVNIDQDASLQASIRHAAERAQNITYIFSGSKQRPLRRLFSGKENPLYELCTLMPLDKISEEDYRYYIQKEAVKKWNYKLSEAILNKIFHYTERYPKYINALCGNLWASDLSPSIEIIDKLWEEYILAKKTDIIEELAELKINQRRLLAFLSLEPANELYSREMLNKINMSQSSIKAALDTLIEKDLVIHNDGYYQVLDPAIKYYLRHF